MLTHLRDELKRLNQQHGGGPCQLHVKTPEGDLTADVETIDQLACTFTLLQLQADRIAAATIA